MFKRITSLMLTLALLISAFPVQAMAEETAAETEPTEHVHSYASQVTQEASCDTEGVNTYACDCGDSYTEAISALGHSYEAGVCLRCGAADPDYVNPETETEPKKKTEPEKETEPSVPEEPTQESESKEQSQNGQPEQEPVQVTLETLEDALIETDGTAAFRLDYSASETEGLTFQWQRLNADAFSQAYPDVSEEDREAAWEDIEDACEDTYELKEITQENYAEFTCYSYRCVVCLSEQQWVSNEAGLIWEEPKVTDEEETPKEPEELKQPENTEQTEPSEPMIRTDTAESAEPAMAAGDLEEAPATDFTYSKVTLDSGDQVISISKYKGTATAVKIPSQIESLPVRTLASGAFSGKTTLQTVIIPEGVTEIASGSSSSYGVFYNCTALTSVSLPSTLTTLGKYAFYGCSALTQINLPDGIETVGSGAFRNCSSLADVTLPENLKTLDSNAFYNCAALTELTLPQGLQTIGSSALYNTGITRLELPDSVTSVSLSNTSPKLTYLRWTASIPTIEYSQFRYWSALEEIVIPEGVTTIAEGFKETTSYETCFYGAFYNCTALKKVTLPDSLESIGMYAFTGCTSLETVTIGTGLKTVGDYAFQDCALLKAFDAKSSALESIGIEAFAGCKAMASLVLPDTLTTLGKNCFEECTALTEVALPDGIQLLPNYAFNKCSSLSKVTLPSSLKEIGIHAFADCAVLSQVQLPDGLETIQSYAFNNCAALDEIDIPDGFKTLKANAFKNTGIIRLEFPDSVTDASLEGIKHQLQYLRWTAGVPKLPSDMMQGGVNLKTLILPEGVTEITDGGVIYNSNMTTSQPYSPFHNCIALESVILPNSLTKIGKWAFRECVKLAHVQLGKNVASIAGDAFQDCSGYTFAVWPGTYGEEYAVSKGIDYIYAGNNGAVEVSLDPAAYQGMQLVLTVGNVRRVLKVGTASTYRFTGLEEATTGTLQVKNTYGDVIRQIDSIAISPVTTVSLKGSVSMGALTLTLLDDNGNDITSQAAVEWLDGNGDLYATGAALAGIPAGKLLKGQVRLNEKYGKTHVAPETQNITVEEGSNTITLTLERFPLIGVEGRVMDSAGALAGASVVVSQTLNGKYIHRTTAVTDKYGNFYLEIPGADVKLSVTAYGYRDYTDVLDVSGGSIQLEDITLEKVTGTKIQIDASYIQSVLPGKEPASQKVSDLDELDFYVFNRTRNQAVTAMLRQDKTLLLADHFAAGDTLEITVSHVQGSYRPVTEEVSVSTANTGSLKTELVQWGSIQATLSDNRNPVSRLMIFNQDGTRVWQETGENSFASAALQDGTYTVLAMGNSSFFTVPNTLEGIRRAGLKSGTDYVTQDITVSAGHISQCSIASVPLLDESRFYYTDPAATSYTTSKTSITAGKFFTLRASAAFEKKYAEGVSNVCWIFELPEGLQYHEGTMSVGGNSSAAYTHDSGILTIPTNDPSQVVRFCVDAVGQGEVTVPGYLEFTYQGERIRQPVGTVNVKIGALDFWVTDKTFDTAITINGTAASNAEIYVYDNNVLVGQTQASAGGFWKLTFDLYKPGTISEHKIYAEMELENGTRIRSVTHTVSYQYDPDPVSVSTVSMFLGSQTEPAAVFDFQNPQTKGMSYSINGNENITFVAKFDCDDLTKLSDVTLNVDLTDGNVRMLGCIYDEAQQAFVTSAVFSINALPLSVSVSYVYDGDLVFAQSDLNDLKQSENDLTLSFNAINKSMEQTPNRLDPFELNFGEDIVIPAEVQADLVELNRLLEEYKSYQTQLEAIQTRLYGQIDFTENGMSSHGGLIEADISQTTLSAFSVKDKAAEGYSVFRVGESDALILVRMENDPVTGSVEQSIIDTSSNGQEAAMFSRMSALDYMALSDAELNSLPMQSGRMYNGKIGHIAPEIEADPNVVANETEDMNAIVANMGSVSASMGEIYSSLDRGLENMEKDAFNQVEDLFRKHANELDPDKKLEIKKQLNQAEKNYDEIKAIGAEKRPIAQKRSDFFGRPAAVVGAVFDAIDLKNDAFLYGQLDYMSDQVYDPDIVWARRQVLGRMCVSALSFAGNAFAIFGAFAAVSVGAPIGAIAALVLGIGGGIIIPWLFRNKTDQDIKKVLSKYSGSNAGGSAVIKPIIDPSGYIYEAVASNRLSGVTVTCYEKVTKLDQYDEEYTEIHQWAAEEFDQINPMITDDMGQYAWDVPGGLWRVKAERDGYETVYSDWLVVPPPQLDVNLGMVSYEQPVISSVDAGTDLVEITFSKYMRAELLTADNIAFTAEGQPLAGTITLPDAEGNPQNPQELFAKTVRFALDEPVADGVQIGVSVKDKLVSYADVAISGQKQISVAAEARPDSLTADAVLELDYQQAGTVRVQASPAELAAGRKVLVSIGSEMLLQAESTELTLDEKGCAAVRVTGMLPGATEILFSLEDTRLQATTQVTIRMPEILECDHAALMEASVVAPAECWDNHDGQTHHCVGVETVHLVCQICNKKVDGELDGTTYPYSMDVHTDEDHTLTGGACIACGYTESAETLRLTAAKYPGYLRGGKTLQMTAYQMPGNKKVTASWSITEGKEYASVNSKGLITAKKTVTDMVTIQVTAKLSNGTQASRTIVLLPGSSKLKLTRNGVLWAESGTTAKTYTVDLHEIKNLSLMPRIHGVGTVSPITWTSSSTTYAKVSNGVVTLVKPGTVTITAKDAYGVTASLKLKIIYLDAATKLTAKADVPAMGLQEGYSTTMQVFGTDKNTPISTDELTFSIPTTQQAIATVDPDTGVITAGSKPGTVTVTAAIKNDPLKRKVTLKVKIIALQTEKMILRAPAETPAEVIWLDADGNVTKDKSKAVNYRIYLDRDHLTSGSYKFTIWPELSGTKADGSPVNTTGIGVSWATTDSRVATVAANKDGSATVTVKAKIDGACVITGTSKDIAKIQSGVMVYVRDYAPRLESTSLTMNSKRLSGVSTRLVESYDTEIISWKLYEYDSKTKKYLTEESTRLTPVWENGVLTIKPEAEIKNSTIKLRLDVGYRKALDGEELKKEFFLTLKVSNSVPTITVKQEGKFNLHTGTETKLTVTAANAAVTKVAVDEPETSTFCQKAYADGVVTLELTPAYQELGVLDAKVTLQVSLDDYRDPVPKTVTMSTAVNKPTITVKQPAKFNLFYKDSKAAIQVTAKDLEVKDVKLVPGSTATFERVEFNPETGNLTIGFTGDYISKRGKVDTSASLLIYLDGYNAPITKAVTIGTVTTKPSVAVTPASSVINTSLTMDHSVLLRVYNKTEQTYIPITPENVKTTVASLTQENDGVRLMLNKKTGKSNTVTVTVQPEKWMSAIKLTHKMTDNGAKPTMSLSSTALKLNRYFTEQKAETQIKLSQNNLNIETVSVVPTSTKAAVLAEAWLIGWNEANGVITLSLTPGDLPANGTYEFRCTVKLKESETPLSKTFKVTVHGSVPTVKVKTNPLKLNAEQAEYQQVATSTVSLTNGTGYSIVRFEPNAYAHPGVEVFYNILDGLIYANLNPEIDVPNGKYVAKFNPILRHEATGQEVLLMDSIVSVPVQVYRTKAVPKLGTGTLKLNRIYTEQKTDTAVTLNQAGVLIKDVTFTPTAKINSDDWIQANKIELSYADGRIQAEFKNPEDPAKAKTYSYRYKVVLTNNQVLADQTIKVTVHSTVPGVKLKNTTLKLNKVLAAKAEVQTQVTMTGGTGFLLTDMKTPENWSNSDFAVSFLDGVITVKLLNAEAANKTHTVNLTPVVQDMATGQVCALAKTVPLKVQIYSGKLDATLTTKGKLDAILPDSAITYTVTKLTNVAGIIEKAELEGDHKDLFAVELDNSGSKPAIKLTMAKGVAYATNVTYKPKLVLHICGQAITKTLSVKVSQSGLKFASVAAMPVYQSQTRTVRCTVTMTGPAGAEMDKIALGTNSSAAFLKALGADNNMMVSMAADKRSAMVTFFVRNPGYLTYGQSYTVYLDVTPEGCAGNVKPTQVKLTVKAYK